MIYLIIYFFIQLFAFYLFYKSKDGQKAIYDTWYDWIIDIAAILSGFSIMTFSIILLYNPWIFAIPVSSKIFYFLFILGSWQFSIHLLKLLIRNKEI